MQSDCFNSVIKLNILLYTSRNRNELLSSATTLHPFNGLFPRTTWISQHQKGKSFWILLEQEMMGWQWHQLDHKQIICTLFQTDNQPVPHHSLFFTGRMSFLPPNQQHQSTGGYYIVKIDSCLKVMTVI